MRFVPGQRIELLAISAMGVSITPVTFIGQLPSGGVVVRYADCGTAYVLDPKLLASGQLQLRSGVHPVC